MYYFAYGSNLLMSQMRRRCPGSRPVGKGVLKDWQFHINKRGSASAIPNIGEMLEGGVFKVSPWHFDILDGFEGVRLKHYRRRFVKVELANDSQVPAIIYQSLKPGTGYARYDYINTAVIPGAKEFGLSASWIDMLENLRFKTKIGVGKPRYIGVSVQSKHKSGKRPGKKERRFP